MHDGGDRQGPRSCQGTWHPLIIGSEQLDDDPPGTSPLTYGYGQICNLITLARAGRKGTYRLALKDLGCYRPMHRYLVSR